MDKNKVWTANLIIFIVALCSLLYELVIGSLMVMLFGDVVYYFSLTIAFFILFMGIGSSLTRYFKTNFEKAFLAVEILICFLGASAAPFVLILSAVTHSGLLTIIGAFFFIASIGLLTGMELPLLFCLTPEAEGKKMRFGSLLIYDYLGSLIGAVLFVFILLPKLDFIGTGTFAALLNLGAIIFIFNANKNELSRKDKTFYKIAIVVLFSFCGLLKFQEKAIQEFVVFNIFKTSSNTKIVSSFRTQYQKVTVTLTPIEDIKTKEIENNDHMSEQWISIYLNSFLQAKSPYKSETDFYHHAFVHPAMLLAGERKDILILGGGDGLPAKEVLKYPSVKRIVNVDLDGEWVNFTRTNELMREHSYDSLNNAKLDLVIADAFRWVRECHDKFDVVLVDFPEGIDIPLARSYSLEFLKDLKRILKDDGVISFQVDFFDNPVYWSIVKTMIHAGYKVIPHHTLDPVEAHGLILLSNKIIPLINFNETIKQFPFIYPKYLVSREKMEDYRSEEKIQKNIMNYQINTFFNPTFLFYYRASFPWEISLGNN